MVSPAPPRPSGTDPALPGVSVAYVLAAGLGTRLRPLTLERPKPLVEVCGTPLVDFTLKLLERAGVRRVALNSHWLHPQLPRTLGERRGGLELTFTHEPEVLGTGGGLLGLSRALPAPAGERVVVMNADALIDLDLGALLASPADALATLVLQETPDVHRYGAIGTDASDRIVTFAGRIEPLGAVVRERMFCGVHLVHPRAFDVLPEVRVHGGVATGAESGINDEGYPVWLKRGAVLRAFDTRGTFCDVGTPERLLEANLALLSGAWSSTFLDPFGRFEQRAPHVWVAPGARVDPTARLTPPVLVDAGAVVGPGAQVGFSVVGRDAEVPAGVRLFAAVLQSGARARSDVEHTILAPTCALPVAPAVASPIVQEWQERCLR